jgi:hypothetical protein
LKHRFRDFGSRISDIQNAENYFSGLFAHLKHHFIDFTKVAFYDEQKAEYEFLEPFAYMKHLFCDFVQFAFLDA